MNQRLRTGLCRLFALSIVAVALNVLAAPSPAPAEATIDFRILIQQHVDLTNQGDLAGVMATFSDDAVLSGGAGPCIAAVCVGKAAIQREFERIISVHAQVKITSLQETTTGSGVGRLEIRNDLFPPCGVQRIVVTFNVDVKNDKIASYSSRPAMGDAQTAAYLACLASPAQTPAPAVRPPSTGDGGLLQDWP